MIRSDAAVCRDEIPLTDSVRRVVPGQLADVIGVGCRRF